MRHFLAGVLSLSLAALSLTACRESADAAAPPTAITIGTVYAGGSWDVVGRALAEAYTKRLPATIATARTTEVLEEHMDAMQRGDVDLAIVDAETAYLAYSTGTRQDSSPHKRLRAIAVLFSTAVQVVARQDAGISRVADLRGKRLAVGRAGAPTERAARFILEAHGVPWSAVTIVPPGDDAAASLRNRESDARFIYAPFQNPIIAGLARSGDVRLVPLDQDRIAAVQERHHFLKSTTIPKGTYRNQDEDVLTVGMDVLLLSREDLAEGLVYKLARALFESVPDLTVAHASAAGIDPDRGPTATIPLHPGAARFYREREILK